MLQGGIFLLLFTCFALPAVEGALLCYYESWAVYRNGDGNVVPDKLDPNICTHYIYAFAGINNDYTIKVLDPWADLCDGWSLCGYKKFTGLKAYNRDLLTLLSVGGWNEGSQKFSQMAASPDNRAVFIKSTVEHLKRHNFDGLDLSWSYPTFSGGAPQDRDNFVHLLRELTVAMSPEGLVLTISVAPTRDIIDAAYDIPNISRHVSLVSVMTYNFHGPWEPYTHHHSSLYPFIGDNGNNILLNMNAAMQYWIIGGMPAHKLVMGVPMFGRCWTLNSEMEHKYYAPAYQPGHAGPWTYQPGFMAYSEICKLQAEEGWTVAIENGCNEPYTYHIPSGKIWCSYEDKTSVAIKAKYAVDEGLGGVMVWSINDDDAHGSCSGRTFDLTKTIAEVFNTVY